MLERSASAAIEIALLLYTRWRAAAVSAGGQGSPQPAAWFATSRGDTFANPATCGTQPSGSLLPAAYLRKKSLIATTSRLKLLAGSRMLWAILKDTTMGLFDIFKKKAEPTFDNENRLETALRKAATEAAYRPEFYKRLLTEKLVVLTAKEELPEGVQTLEKDAKVNIVSFSSGKIPVFTSVGKIFDKGVVKEEVAFLEMKGEDIFNLAKGATFVLNPYSDYAKELLPREIESMLNGTVLTDSHKQIVIEKETQIQIGQPANYPADIINSLKILFASKPTVRKAYLGWIFSPSSGEPPHYIFALDIEGETQSITNEAGFTAKQFLKPEDIIDFIQIDKKDGLSNYFLKQTKPFYERLK